MFPQKGHSVLVQHEVGRDRRGIPYEAYAGNKERVQTVDAVYYDGRIRTSSGDVWNVKRHYYGKALWETVRIGPLDIT